MVEPDGRDHAAKRRLYHVGAVQQTAHAGFEHHHVAVLLGVKIKFQRVDVFEFRDDDILSTQLFDQRKGLFDGLRQRLFGDHFVIDLDAFAEIRDIRRDEQSGFIPCRHQRRREHGADGAFAVGTGDVDIAQLVLRIVHSAQQLAHAVESRT